MAYVITSFVRITPASDCFTTNRSRAILTRQGDGFQIKFLDTNVPELNGKPYRLEPWDGSGTLFGFNRTNNNDRSEDNPLLYISRSPEGDQNWLSGFLYFESAGGSQGGGWGGGGDDD